MLKIVKSSKYFLSAFENLCFSTCRNFSIQNQKYYRHYNRKPKYLLLQNLKFFSSDANVHDEEPLEPDIPTITNGDPELEHKLRVLLLEVEVMRQDGHSIPSQLYMQTHHWQELLKLQTKSARRKYLDFLFKVEKKKENRKFKKEQNQIDFEKYKQQKAEEDQEDSEGVMKYNLKNNNIFLRFYDTTINQLYNYRLIQAMQFGQKIVVDCGFQENMTTRENMLCAKQLMLLFSENRMHDDPFDLHFCNLVPDTTLSQALYRHIPSLSELSFPLTVHQESYLDLFPKNNLVYLTPHCRNELSEFNHDDIYIIGGIVDKVNNEPLSLAKAKREGLRMAKLPLDHYLQWGGGSGKSLTLNQVVAILLDAKHTSDWKYALRHVPKRKLVDLSVGSAINKTNNNFSYDKSRKWKPIVKAEKKLNVRDIFSEDKNESATEMLLNLRKTNK